MINTAIYHARTKDDYLVIGLMHDGAVVKNHPIQNYSQRAQSIQTHINSHGTRLLRVIKMTKTTPLRKFKENAIERFDKIESICNNDKYTEWFKIGLIKNEIAEFRFRNT